jgi:hypothetical protein
VKKILFITSIAFAHAALAGTATIQVNWFQGNYTTAPNGAGGEFGGTSQVGNSTPVLTNFWCVDDQLDFNFGNTGLASVVRLNNVSSVPVSQVQYGNVNTGAGSPSWTNQSAANGFTALDNTAQARYQMEAYLVQQYSYINEPSGFNAAAANSGLASLSSSNNEAIQMAIWALTSNNSPITGGYNTTGISGLVSDPTHNAYWINQALNAYNSGSLGSIPNNWAVVSWNVNNSGNTTSPYRQTFLAQIGGSGGLPGTSATPEPGFYGALALGLAGLGFAIRRRKLAAGSTR